MPVLEYMDYIEINPEIMRGKAVIKGTRITVEAVLDMLSESLYVEGIIDDYPSLDERKIKAALAYASRNIKKQTSEKKGSVAVSKGKTA